jgi:hypothetical protein
MGRILGPRALAGASYLVLPERWISLAGSLYHDTAVASSPYPYLNYAPSSVLPRGETEQSRDVIYFVNSELQLWKEMTSFLTTLEMKVVSYAPAVEHPAFAGGDTAAYAIPNICISDISGLELQRRLAERADRPAIFVGDRCEIPSTVSAMKGGASA